MGSPRQILSSLLLTQTPLFLVVLLHCASAASSPSDPFEVLADTIQQLRQYEQNDLDPPDGHDVTRESMEQFPLNHASSPTREDSLASVYSRLLSYLHDTYRPSNNKRGFDLKTRHQPWLRPSVREIFQKRVDDKDLDLDALGVEPFPALTKRQRKTSKVCAQGQLMGVWRRVACLEENRRSTSQP